jgi:hypothetical protein
VRDAHIGEEDLVEVRGAVICRNGRTSMPAARISTTK